jgi:phosphotransferase system HPr (HPr) family protein
MADVTLIVRNPSGLHARPAAIFVRSAASFDADVRVTNLTRDPDKVAPAGSLLAVLALGVSRGHEIRISAEGDDADEALSTLTELVEGGLGEPVDADAGAAEG